METLLYKPLFINPQAYYVFPNINGRLEPKTGSGKEPAIFVGNIEVKTIAHGDIGKKQYFYNTNEIDLSAFSNSLVRISLYTSRGNVVLGEWNLDVVEGESEDYIDPEILDSLCGVWIADQNTNESESRSIIKNKIADRGGDLELLNFGYKLNSGYGKYEVDFTIFNDITDCTIIGNKIINHSEVLFRAQYNYEIKRIDVESFNAKVENITKGYIGYTYRDNNGIEKTISFTPETIKANNGIITLPKSYNTLENSTGILGGLYGYGVDEGATITQIPSFEGALVTDGKDDLITSTKTVQEMLGGSNEITVVSMMLNLENEKITYTNQIRPFQNGYIRNNVISNTGGKYGIYGYKITDISDIFKNRISINDVLGDRKDYGMDTGGTARIDGKFSVEGYCFNDGTIGEVSQVAWYWTIISKIALTTDQINQVISYFNLDKHVKPDVYYDVKKQGLSNDTPEADWYLKDFSGNGHDMTLYNFAKKLGSGIGKYEVDFNTWIPQSYVADSAYTSNKLHITNIKGGNAILYTKKGANAMKVKITGIQSFNLVYRYIAENDVWEALEVDRDGIYELPASTTTTKTYYTGFTVPYYTGDCDITIEQIPDYEGALVFDAVDDYGQFVGDLGLEDYTIAVDRAYVEAKPSQVSIMSNVVDGSTNTPFLMEHMGINKILAPHSFGKYTALSELNINRFISYQSTYKYNRNNLDRGTSTNTGSGLTIGRIGGVASQYANIALWSLLLFPYTLSEFLLERQLKRYKLGTLYPDMVEWRPIFNSNVDIDKYHVVNKTTNKQLSIGDYFAITDTIELQVYLTDRERQEITSLTINGKSFTPTFIDTRYLYNIEHFGEVTGKKSLQKINITIDEYIRYEDIVQPYPAIINLKQDGKTITWGDKLKVGSDIVFVESANLLPELYTVSETRYNGVTLYPNTIIKVEKSMVFDNARIYLKANEPNCILSPNRLRIPNSSYKILKYIPDLTGKGNHGVINNSAYVGMSGANGYKYDWNTWRISKSGITSTVTDSRLHITSLKEQYNPNQALFESRTPANTGDKADFKVNITGLTSDMKCTFNNSGAVVKELVNGVNEISADLVAGWYGFMITALDGSVIGDCDITIQQIGQYEGSFCFDGTDDYITIPTLSHGSKQVLMKVNYKLSNSTCTIYDQRDPARWLSTFCIYSNNEAIAYSTGNSGKTYIDGVLNTSIKGRQLANITHNITIANEDVTDVNSVSPKIGTLFVNGSAYAQMALFDFMLFPDISSEEEIKELNDIVGIEGNTDDLLIKN